MNRRLLLKSGLAGGVGAVTLLALTGQLHKASADTATLVTNPLFQTSSSTFKVSMDTTTSSVLKFLGTNPQTGIVELVGLVTVDGGNGNQYGEVALGQDALSKWAPGQYLGDTAIGFQALMNDVGTGNGASNVGVGFQALVNNRDGQSNCAIGVWAMHENLHGNYNAYFGELAGFWNLGNYNSAFGRSAGYGQPNADGHHNAGLGHEANHVVRHGSYNTALGAETGFNNQDGSGNIFIGYNGGYYETGSNTFYLWNQSTGTLAGDRTHSLMYGVMDPNPANQTLNINAVVTIGGALTANGLRLAGRDVLELIDELRDEIRSLKRKLSEQKVLLQTK